MISNAELTPSYLYSKTIGEILISPMKAPRLNLNREPPLVAPPSANTQSLP